MNRIVNVMHSISQKALNDLPDLLFGEVTSVDPIAVKIENKFELSEDFLILGAMVKETWINIPEDDDNEHTHEEDKSLSIVTAVDVTAAPITFTMNGIPSPSLDLGHKHTIHDALPKIKLWRGLKVGDNVRMFRVGRGQRYYVFEREEGITNDS